MQFHVHYMKPGVSRDFGMGHKWLAERGQLPTLETLDQTHIPLKTLEYEFVEGELWRALEKVFRDMQGEFWSPNGEARPLIRSKGLQHTSMSVGDAVVADGKLWLVDRFGFQEIE